MSRVGARSCPVNGHISDNSLKKLNVILSSKTVALLELEDDVKS